MATQKFLRLILPDKGTKVIALATPTKNGGAWFKYKTYDSIDDAANAARVFDDDATRHAFNAHPLRLLKNNHQKALRNNQKGF